MHFVQMVTIKALGYAKLIIIKTGIKKGVSLVHMVNIHQQEAQKRASANKELLKKN